MATGLGIFELPIFANIILPFVLMFVVVFAILEKTDILGKEKRQINAIVAFVFSLIYTSVPGAVSVTKEIIPIVGVAIIVFLSFMLLFGFVGGQTNPMNKGIRITAGIVILIALIITLLQATGSFPVLKGWFSLEEVLSTAVLLVFIIAIFSVVLTSKPEPESKEKK